MMIVPVLKPHFWSYRDRDYDRDRGREKPLDGKSIVRLAISEWAGHHGRAGMLESLVDSFVDVVGRQMELRQAGSRGSKSSEVFLEEMKAGLQGAVIRITMMIHDDTHYEVGVPPDIPRELDRLLGNKTCKRCKLFIVSGTWVAHSEFACNTKIVQDLMSK